MVRSRQQFPPKYWYPSTKTHGVTSRKYRVILIFGMWLELMDQGVPVQSMANKFRSTFCRFRMQFPY
jgi:hypothetical protein